ncbi:hypothetical protein BV898_16086 [Hypsibius exemplaris]|uniref:Uncharacterized protein n=1 Tax=Hypsibius exemplaris TaxID=2072580 RepID=A0A9X6NEM9_HYPEX|nr:hypothetical protein BV898_16086 [Hypsibius exemplaris]
MLRKNQTAWVTLIVVCFCTKHANSVFQTKPIRFPFPGNPSKVVELVVTVQDNSRTDEIASPGVNAEAHQNLFSNLSLKGVVEAAITQFRRNFSDLNLIPGLNILPETLNDLEPHEPLSNTSLVTPRLAQFSDDDTLQKHPKHLPLISGGDQPLSNDQAKVIASHCIFFTNCSYSCKTNCDATSSTIIKTFPGDDRRLYHDRNCSEELAIDHAARWKEADGIVMKHFDSARTNEIIATCSFYQINMYECYGVSDCSTRIRGTESCAGSAPWMGSYEGSPVKGFGWRGNITHVALNNAASGSQGHTTSNGTLESGVLKTCN